MSETRFARMLGGGDRRSIGMANRVVAQVLKDTGKFKELVRCLWNDDPIVRMRAADAVEKVSGRNPKLLQPFKADLLKLSGVATQQELRWHMAQIMPRLDLSGRQRQRAANILGGYLKDRSSIVKTFALQALADMSRDYATLRAEVRALVDTYAHSGTAAVRARCRKLQKDLASK